jgi:hypothetical protein
MKGLKPNLRLLLSYSLLYIEFYVYLLDKIIAPWEKGDRIQALGFPVSGLAPDMGQNEERRQ